MPSALSHHLFARGCMSLADAGQGRGRTIGPSFVDAAYAGSQGPDPLFFVGYIPWRKRAGVAGLRTLGTELHGIDPRGTYLDLAARAIALPADGPREAALGFVTGLVLHYALDERVHPIVRSATGTDMIAHHRYEALLAAQMAASDPPDPRWLVRAPGTIDTADTLLRLLPGNRLQPGDFSAAWHDMYTALRVLEDPTGIKAALLRKLLPETAGGALASTLRFFGSLIVPRPGACGPLDPETAKALASARKTGFRAISAAQAVLRGEAGPESFGSCFDGLNHDGLPPGPAM